VGVGLGLHDADAEPKGVLVSPLGDAVPDRVLVRVYETDWVAVGTQFILQVKVLLPDAESLWETEEVKPGESVTILLAVDVLVCEDV